MSSITDEQAKEMGQQVALVIGRVTKVIDLMSRISKEVLRETYAYDVTVRMTHKTAVITLVLTNRYRGGSIVHDTTAYAIISHILSRDTFTDLSLHTEWLVSHGPDELYDKDTAVFSTTFLLSDAEEAEYHEALDAAYTGQCAVTDYDWDRE
jgi:hypothetical protein